MSNKKEKVLKDKGNEKFERYEDKLGKSMSIQKDAE